MALKIEKIDLPKAALSRRGGSDLNKLREKLSALGLHEGIRIEFDTPKKHVASYVHAATSPLTPKKFSYRTLDNDTETPGKIFGIWRIK